MLLEAIACAGVMALTGTLARAVWPSLDQRRRRRLMVLSGLTYALNGTTQRFTGVLLSEALLLPLLPPALLATLRVLRRPAAGRAVPAALLWAAILLTKPNAQYLVLAVGVLVTVQAVALAPRRAIPALSLIHI